MGGRIWLESDGRTAPPSYDAVTESPDVRSVEVINAVGRVVGASPATAVGTSVAREPWFGVAEWATVPSWPFPLRRGRRRIRSMALSPRMTRIAVAVAGVALLGVVAGLLLDRLLDFDDALDAGGEWDEGGGVFTRWP